MQLKDTLVKLTSVTPAMMQLPISIDNSKCDILVGRSCSELDNHSLGESFVFDNLIRWRFGFVNQIRIEYIELVALNDLGWWIVFVVMRRVVSVPLVPGDDAIEILWLSWSILVLPVVRLAN